MITQGKLHAVIIIVEEGICESWESEVVHERIQGAVVPAGPSICILDSQCEEWLRVIAVVIAWPLALRQLLFFVLAI